MNFGRHTDLILKNLYVYEKVKIKMFYTKFKHYIIFCLIKQMTMILYVSGRPTDSDKTKLFTDEQLKYLALSVCSDLEFDIHVVR